MNIKTRFLSLFLCLCLLFSMAGCTTTVEENQNDTNASANTENTQDQSDSSNADPVWPITLTDQAGREITISEKPERIVSCYYISSSLLIALDLEDQLVGIEAKANTRNIYALAAPQLIDLPNTGSMKEFNLEGCIAMEPDLVIMPVKLAEHADTLSELGITVLLVNPESSSLLEEAISLIGQATGTSDRANALLNYYSEMTELAASLTADIKNRPTVYLAGNSDMLSTATSDMYQNGLIVDVGGTNVAAEIQDSYWATISYEQLLKWDPDYIVIVPEASYTVEDVLNTEVLSGLSAVQNKNVIAMPSSFEAWDSPVPSGILGYLWMLNLLHPDLLSDEDLIKEVSYFYQEFYGFEIDPDALFYNNEA